MSFEEDKKIIVKQLELDCEYFIPITKYGKNEPVHTKEVGSLFGYRLLIERINFEPVLYSISNKFISKKRVREAIENIKGHIPMKARDEETYQYALRELLSAIDSWKKELGLTDTEVSVRREEEE